MPNLSRFSPRTEIGQNFLVDHNLLRCIVEDAAILPGENILEIGPGKGVLTKALLDSPCGRVDAVELDRRLAPFLEPYQQHHAQRFFLHWGDAVRFDYPSLPNPTGVVANIPYHITTPLIWKLLEDLAPRGLQRMILMVQKEAAERLMAPLRSKTRYPLGVTLELMGTVKILRTVPPEAFRPIPRVDSALVRIDLTAHRDLPTLASWRELLRKAFGERRKMLRNSLGTFPLPLHSPSLEVCLQSACLPATARPEELEGEAWLRLWRLLGGEKQQSGTAPV